MHIFGYNTFLTAMICIHLFADLRFDAGLAQLAGLSALKDLRVTRTAVTAEGATALQQKLPDTKIQLRYLGN